MYFALRKIALFFVIFLMSTLQPALAADITGIWLRDTGSSRMRIAPCNKALCGTLIWLLDPRSDTLNPDERKRSQPLLGTRIFFDMVRAGRTDEWKGQAYNPEDGRTYTGFITLNGNELVTQGCVAGGLICRSVSWSRVN